MLVQVLALQLVLAPVRLRALRSLCQLVHQLVHQLAPVPVQANHHLRLYHHRLLLLSRLVHLLVRPLRSLLQLVRLRQLHPASHPHSLLLHQLVQVKVRVSLLQLVPRYLLLSLHRHLLVHQQVRLHHHQQVRVLVHLKARVLVRQLVHLLASQPLLLSHRRPRQALLLALLLRCQLVRLLVLVPVLPSHRQHLRHHQRVRLLASQLAPQPLHQPALRSVQVPVRLSRHQLQLVRRLLQVSLCRLVQVHHHLLHLAFQLRLVHLSLRQLQLVQVSHLVCPCQLAQAFHRQVLHRYPLQLRLVSLRQLVQAHLLVPVHHLR